MTTKHVFVVMVLIGGSATAAAASEGPWSPGGRLEGPVVQVIDADTLRVRLSDTGLLQDIRLDAIDAPEHDQTCIGAAGAVFACGQAATAFVAGLVGGTPIACPSLRHHGLCLAGGGIVDCVITDVDNTPSRRPRPVARCRDGRGRDIGAELVATGMAMARYGNAYVVIERQAKAARKGFWAGTFADPARWRRRSAG